VDFLPGGGHGVAHSMIGTIGLRNRSASAIFESKISFRLIET